MSSLQSVLGFDGCAYLCNVGKLRSSKPSLPYSRAPNNCYCWMLRRSLMGMGGSLLTFCL